jgi:alditol oxidase
MLTREHNWADNYSFTATHIHCPDTIDDVRRLVASSSKIRAVGTRHSFNGIADSPGVLIDLGGLDPHYVIDPERMTVTVGANTIYGTLAAYLQAQGYALHNMGSLPHISVAGAIATGTHGSGDANGNLSTAVAGLELVTGSGDVIHFRRGDEGFDGIVVGLGAFGIVTRVTLDVEASFDIRQDAFIDLPWETVLSNFDAVSAAAYSVSLLTKWNDTAINRMWLKTRLFDGRPLKVAAEHLGAKPAINLISSSLDDPTARLNPFGGVPGPWSERLPHFRVDRQPGVLDQIQSEYMVPRSNAVVALTALRAIGDRIDPHLHSTEIRTMAADGLWLSPAFGHPAVAIHFTWQRKPAEVNVITREIEDILLPIGGRPHWGKLLHAGAEKLAPLYPRLPAFRALADHYDPAGKFRNAYLAKHVFG